MIDKETLKEAYDNDIEILKKAYESDKELAETVQKIIDYHIRTIWSNVIDSLKNSGKFMLASSVVLAYPVDKGDVVDIVFKQANKANKEMVDNKDNIKAIEDAFYDVSSRDVKINFAIQGKTAKTEKEPVSNNIMNLAKQFPDIVSVDESEE